MTDQMSVEAWNNFVTNSEPDLYKPGSQKRAASLVSLYMGLANNGGINSFLTSTSDLDASEIRDALQMLGATTAASELDRVLSGINIPLQASSQKKRWDLLELYWTDDLDDFDVVSEEADAEMISCLRSHVIENESFYLTLQSEKLQ